MTTYVIGDVHGCYQTLMALLDKIHFAIGHDTLYLVGDLVGRGPQPREVVQFVVETPNVFTCFGNHDLWAMASAYGCQPSADAKIWIDLFHDDAGRQLLDQWRLQSSMMILDRAQNLAVVHAGIPPNWSLQQAYRHAQCLDAQLHSAEFLKVFSLVEGDHPHCWDDTLDEEGRIRYTMNAFTRMRFCDAKGCLDFREKNVTVSEHVHLKPWFAWPIDLGGYQLFYGHWAALEGQCDHDHIIATDTGCVYGGALSAFKIQANQPIEKFQVSSCEVDVL